MSCNGCLQDPKNREIGVAIVLQQAKELALKNNCNVYLYHTEEGIKYMVEEAAHENGIQPSAGIVSPLQPIAV